MAIIRTSSVVAAISGSIGSTTFVLGKHGPHIRTRPRQLSRRTQKQLTAHAARQWAQSYWHQISQLQRKEWAAAAATFPVTNSLGVKSFLSPYQFFLKQQTIRKFWSLTIYPSPLTQQIPPAVRFPTFNFNEGGPFLVTINDDPFFFRVIIRGARHFSSNTSLRPRILYPITRDHFVTGVPISIETDFLKTMGSPLSGEALTITFKNHGYSPAVFYSPTTTFQTTVS